MADLTKTYLGPNEKSPIKQNSATRQLLEVLGPHVVSGATTGADFFAISTIPSAGGNPVTALKVDNNQSVTIAGGAGIAGISGTTGVANQRAFSNNVTPLQIQVPTPTTGPNLWTLELYGYGNNGGGGLAFGQSRATLSTGTGVLQNLDNIGEIWNYGDDGVTANLVAAGGLTWFVDTSVSPVSAGNIPITLTYTINTLGEQFRSDSLGNFLVGKVGGVLGYSTGAGAVANQSSSTSTGSITDTCTNNHQCGAINTVSNSWTSGTPATFQVNNSKVKATDTIIANVSSPDPATAIMTALVTFVSAGAFKITIYPLTTHTNPVTVQYSVIRATQS